MLDGLQAELSAAGIDVGARAQLPAAQLDEAFDEDGLDEIPVPEEAAGEGEAAAPTAH